MTPTDSKNNWNLLSQEVVYLLYSPQKAFLLNDHSYLLGSSVSLGLGAVNQEKPAWIQVKVDIFANFLSTCFQKLDQ